MHINEHLIKPGENKTIELSISKLSSGTDISISAHVFRSKNDGPTILVAGGVHGDEINGVEIVRRAVYSDLLKNLNCGTVIALPLVNVYGFINFSRELPDGKDVNRSFPGSKTGSLASRVAQVITKEILPHIDIGLDFHTGGASIYNYPQCRAYRNDEQSLSLAKIFNAPLTIESGLVSRSLRKEAFKHDIPMIVYEGGESLRLDHFSITEGINGIKRVLHHYGMIDENIGTQDMTILTDHKWLRASTAGIFIPKKVSGEWFKKGDLLGILTNPYGQFEKEIIAKQDGFIFGHDNKPVINPGKALFHIGS
jgi:predicted deacylase